MNLGRLLLIMAAISVGIVEARNVPEKASGVAVDPPLRGLSFEERLSAIHDEWMGTAWSFHGVSQTPRHGSIACGYFVTTTLIQAGMEIDRVRLAQAPSERMIIEIVDSATIRRFRHASVEDFLNGVKAQGNGYYLVGLDFHTGFLRVLPCGNVVFIHSAPGRGVVAEAPGDAPELADSQYRVTGKLTNPSPPKSPPE